jgi:hypothetical protein
MGKRLSETVRRAERRRCAAVLAVCLLIAGCAQKDRSAEDENRSGGFYGGVSGGLTHP